MRDAEFPSWSDAGQASSHVGTAGMRRLVVNDVRNTLGEHTFWDDLCEWLEAEFVGGDYEILAEKASITASCGELDSTSASLIVRNASWFKPIIAKCPQ